MAAGGPHPPGDGSQDAGRNEAAGDEPTSARSALGLRLALALGVATMLVLIAVLAAFYGAEPGWLLPVVLVLAVIGFIDAGIVVRRMRARRRAREDRPGRG